MKHKRTSILINDLVLLHLLGLVYAWSVFKKPLALRFGWSDAQLTWTFTICMSFFCIGGYLGAQLSKRYRTQTLVRLSALLILLGFLCSAYLTQLWQLYLSYGVLVGSAIGIVYNVVLATANCWYPDRPGFISGLLLMAFGTGSLVLGPLATWLIKQYGWHTTMLSLGIVFLAVFLLTSARVRSPSHEEQSAIPARSSSLRTSTSGLGLAPGAMLRQRDFWLYLVWCTLLTAIGLALVGQVFTIATSFALPDLTASYLVGVVSVCNGLGRIVFGALYDRLGRWQTMLLITACPIIGAGRLILATQTKNIAVMVPALMVIAAGYGGSVPTNANFVRQYYGNTHYATNFSIVNFNILLAVFIGQYVGSSLYMRTGSYLAMALAIIGLAAVALLANMLIKQPQAMTSKKSA